MKINKLSEYTKVFAINHLMGVEGGSKITNIKDDRGGLTKFGITQVTFLEDEFKNLRTKFNIHRVEDINSDFAFAFYEQGWWNRLQLDEIVKIHPIIADRLLDVGVNGGRGLAGTWLQNLLNINNLKQTAYKDIKVDGSVGPATVATLHQFVKLRGNDGVLNLVNFLFSLQGAHYVNLAIRDEKQETFIHGWGNRVRNALDDYYRLLAAK